MGVLNTTPATVAPGGGITAALWNAEVRDALTNLQSAWTSYTPTLTNIGGSSTLSFAYQRWGKTIVYSGIFTATGSTTFSAGNLGFSLPVACHSRYTSAATVMPVGTSTTKIGSVQGGTAVITSTGILNFLVDNLASSNTVTNLIPSTFGSGSTINFTVTYEAA